MKSRTLVCSVAITLLSVLAIPVPLAAQDNQAPTHQYHHYQLVDVGTFGGPQSYQLLNGLAVGVLNNGGAFAGWADTSTIDPLCFLTADCYAAHAFVWQNGAKTDLGVLPGGLNSQANWISANGLTTGVADNGQMDPLLGIPQIRGVFWGHHGGITEVGALPGAYFAVPLAVNSRGEVVGFAANTIPDPDSMAGLGYQTRAFRWDDRKGMQDLGTLPGGTDAMSGMINERGQVFGWSYINSVPTAICPGIGGPVLTTDSFIWDKKNGMKDIGGLGGTCTLAHVLNDRGQIVGGSALTGDPTIHPFVWDAATGVTDLLDPSDGSYGFAEGENDRGEVAGGTCNPALCYALLWRKSGGKWQKADLGTIGGFSFALSINASEQVIGNAGPGPFLWEDGGPMVDLNTLVQPSSGIQLNEAGQINDRGEIAVNGSDANGNNHDVLLIPCDQNHPGVADCDYSMVDASTAPQSSAPRYLPSETQSSPRSRWTNRYHIPGRGTSQRD